MTTKQQSNIARSAYKGLLVLTMILITIFIFKTLLFSSEIYSYDETDKEFRNNKLFSDNDIKTDSISIIEEPKDTCNVKTNEQKNIIKDLTVNKKIININKSLKDELIELPGIGPKTAEKIIKYRAEHGDFQNKEDLKKVKGIGPVKLKKIENLIKLK